jgi:hypothetical protein
MTTHTPGPWLVSRPPSGAATSAPLWIEADGRRIADVREQGTSTAGNAALIETAPDLLSMCERLLGFARHYAHASALLAGEGMFASAEALIAKAKGGAA